MPGRHRFLDGLAGLPVFLRLLYDLPGGTLMTISDKMLARGAAVGLEPQGDESSGSFGNRVRKAEKESRAVKPAPKKSTGSTGWRRF